MSLYKDRWIECTDSGIAIRGYYFPWGTKHIDYGSITALERFTMTALRGKGRIWGTGTFDHWANLDPQRPHKDVGFYVELGTRISPFVTPDNPDDFERVVRDKAHLGPAA